MSRVLNVFYGADRLPYKDQERQVHYPMVGNSFAGASLVDEIRFYAKDLGTENNVFVGIAKRPDGQRGYQVLTYGYDTELNEPYWTFNVAGWFTEKVGNVFVSLNVYQGGVDIEVDEDSGLAIVSGTPIIQATGSVVLSINYAPVMDNGYGAVPTIDVQEALSLVSSKVDTDYLTANYYNKTDVDGKLLLKADLSYVNGFVKTLEVSMDSSTYVLTFTCKDGTGTTISTQSIDLPLESVVVGGEYDSDTQSIILTLQNGNTITIPVSDLVDGLVDTTTFETAIQGIEDELDLKANKSETYDRDYIDGKLDLKADKTTTTSLQNQINDINSRLTVVEEAIIGVDTLTFTALSYSAIPSVSDNLYPIIQSGGLDTKEIKGNSFVHTQLVNKLGTSETINGITFTNNGDGSWTISGTATSTVYKPLNATTTISGRKYLIIGATAQVGMYVYDKSVINANQVFTYGGATVNNYVLFYVANGTSITSPITIVPMFFDLTKDFGAGNEPSTYDQAVSMYASKGIDITNYVEYTQGTLIDSKPVKLYSRKAILPNLPLRAIARVDLGSLSWSKNSADCFYTTSIGNTVKKPASNNVKANVFCNLYSTETLTNVYEKNIDQSIGVYASDGTVLIWDSSKSSLTAGEFKTAMSGVYLYYELATPNAQPTQDIITDLVIHEYPITTEVLRSAGNVQDSAVSKKVGSIDLGTLNWFYNSDEQFFFSTEISGIKVSTTNLTCSKYSYSPNVQTLSGQDKTILARSDSRVSVKDLAYTDAAAFKTAMSGAILNYELATPTEQTATLPADIEIEKGGSLEVVYDNGYTTPADFVFDCAVYKPLD